MSKKAEVMAELFDAYGDDADGALAAMANVSPHVWSQYVDEAASKQYLTDYKAWVRRQTSRVDRTRSTNRLFQVDDTERITLRARIAIQVEGKRKEFATLALAGAHGAELLRLAADRDEAPARTTLIRCALYRRLATQVEKRSKSEGRDVSVGEVVEATKAA